MPFSPVEGARSGPHLLLYDGVCGMCNGIVRWVLAHDRRGKFRFASLQSPAAAAALAQFGTTAADLDTFYVVTNYGDAGSRLLARADGAMFVMSALGWPWKGTGVLQILPASLRNYVYDRIARNRYRMFGRYDHCPVPSPEHRSRFIDQP